MAFNFKEKFDQARQLLAVAPMVAEGLKEQAATKFHAIKDSAQEKIDTGRAVVAQVQAVAPIVIAMKKEEYKGKLNTLAGRFGLAAKPAQQGPEAEMEAFLKALAASAQAEAPAEAAHEEEHEAPAAAEPAAAAPANDTAAKPKKSGGKKKKAAPARKPK